MCNFLIYPRSDKNRFLGDFEDVAKEDQVWCAV
jgi:hypothetical protein